MMQVIDCKNKNYKKKLNNFLLQRRLSKNSEIKIVKKIIKDIKKNKFKALLKYEKKNQ